MAANIRTTFYVLFCIMAAFLTGNSTTAESTSPNLPLEIINITPHGEDVPAGKKIVFQFNRSVVPVGAMDRKASEIPITINPAVKGQWRWLNSSTLACLLDNDSPLKTATRYEIEVNPGIMTEDETTMKEPVKHRFITIRPKVVHTWFRTWRSPSLPVIRVTFNQPVSRSSVENHLFFDLPWLVQRRIKLYAEPDEKDKETPMFLPLPGENITLVTLPDKSVSEEDDDIHKKTHIKDGDRGREARRVWLVYPEKEFPDDSTPSLMVEPGLESFLGPEKGVERRELVKFNTFPEFNFEGIECFNNDRKRIHINPGDSTENRGLCNPAQSVMMVFTSPVLNSEIQERTKFEPSVSWNDVRDYSRLNSSHRRSMKYYVYLPRGFKPDQVYNITGRGSLADEFGRRLGSPINISFATDHLPPDYSLTSPVSVLEKNVDTDIPVVVTNIDELTVSYDTLTSKGKSSTWENEISLPATRDAAMKIPMGVRDMLDAESGVVTGTVSSTPYIRKYGDGNFFFGEVTPFQVHVKMGHFNTLVWVMDLKTGEPVKDAKVSIYPDTYKRLKAHPNVLTQGRTDSKGLVSLAGSDTLDPQNEYLYSYSKDRPMFFTKVEKGGDIALLPMDYNFLMNTASASHNTVYSNKRKKYGHIRAWGTTAQGVYRAGDTIQYKIYVRNQNNEKMVPAPGRTYNLKVIDPMNKTVHEVNDIKLSGFGALDGEFTVPKTGAVGWYRFNLSASYTKETWQPMRVLVSDFTPSPFKVTTDINGKGFLPGDKLDINTQARLHGGGPYTDASTRVTVNLISRRFSSDDPAARGFFFNSYLPESSDTRMLLRKDGNIDDKGNLVTDYTIPESNIYYGRLEIESAVRDDRGKYISGRASANYASRDKFAGIRSDSWLFKENEPATVDLIVVDHKGKPVKDETVKIEAEHQETTAARVKGAGNAYLTRLNTKWVKEESKRIKSDKEAVQFTFEPEHSGLYRITARVKDSKGREHSTELTKWVAGRGMVIWDDDNKNSLDIIPEKTEYRVGETARYMVKNPFPGAKALITIERYGTIKHWVQTLDTATPIIEFEIEKDFIPGFYLSVVVMSPRLDRPPEDNGVDLGKPAFRMGYVQGVVSDPYKKITMKIKPDKETYKPGEKVRVKLNAAYKNKTGNEPVEFAVAVLDEAVLDLLGSGSSYFDPYRGFYQIDNLDMLNYSLLMQLVGRQKFEKKGADPAGDGGGDLGLRTVFKFLSYWNPSIEADSNGEAEIEFDLPDNLTGWRVLAMAVTPGDRMGLGEGRFTVNRPTEIRPVMPNQVTEGDSFEAGFSVMNRTDKERDLEITITAGGEIETDDGTARQKTIQRVKLKPYKRDTLWLPVKSKGSGRIHFTASGGDSLDQDGTVYDLEVHKIASLETGATYGSTDSAEVTETVKFPEDIRTDVGSLFVRLSPTVIGNLEGAFKYLRDYPYPCWEQKITRAVMASHFIELKGYMPADFYWDDAKELPDTIPGLASNYQASSGGMCYYIPEDRFVSPYLSTYTAVAFNWLKDRGYNVPTPVENRLHEYLATMLRRDVAPSFYTRGMASTVRAVALAALAKNDMVTLDDLSRYYPHVKEMDTFGKAHFLMAASLIEGAEKIAKDVFKMIISQSDQTGGKFIINDTFDDGYTRILTSPLRTNAAVLSAFLAYSKTEEGKILTKDIPFRMVRYITQTRKQSGRWENTQENVFCMNAL
ncbi:MAG: alpha-2-macroglobulin family protein, partial [Desulfobacteraceae bacterium]